MKKNHDIIIKLLELYPNAILINFDEIPTIQFASTCTNIILSHGTFSTVIYSNIYYSEYEIDTFSIDNWIKVKYK